MSGKNIKILAVGNSFARNAMEEYMWDMFKTGGYEDVKLGYMFFSGCSIAKHWEFISNNKSGYESYGKNENGEWNVNWEDANALNALLEENWDFVTFQQSPDYGGGPECCGDDQNDYEHFNDLIDWAYKNATNPNMKVVYHMTWSFSKDCYLWSFDFHNKDQMKQYKDIVAATKKYVIPNKGVTGLIPVATAIQNVRSSFMGDTFNNPANEDDGYHLNSRGCFVAALTWYCYFSGQKAVDASFRGPMNEKEYAAIAEAVDNALSNPFEFTESKIK